MSEVLEYSGPLRSVVEKGQYQDLVTVCGDKVLMHVARVHEEQAVNADTAHVPLLDRDYERWVSRLSRVVTRINEHILPSTDEARSFFRSLSQAHIEEYVGAYSKMVQEVRDRLVTKVQEIKN